jgi:type VI secretion system protein ImpM
MADLNNLGFYGKIPSNGDFVSRHLPRTFVDPWDQWLQQSITNSREQLGEHWLDRYLIGPIWRFALSPGVCGDKAWLGLVMPSVDSVGRYFPLTLAVPVNNSCKLLFAADTEESWFAQVEDIALSALDQDNKLETFTEDIIKLVVPNHITIESSEQQSEQQDEISQAEFADNDFWRIAMTESGPISANLNPLMEQFLRQRFPDFTIWWTSGSEQVEASMLICNQLPPTQGFSALLTGDWDQWGWQDALSYKTNTARLDPANIVDASR